MQRKRKVGGLGPDYNCISSCSLSFQFNLFLGFAHIVFDLCVDVLVVIIIPFFFQIYMCHPLIFGLFLLALLMRPDKGESNEYIV